MQEKMQVIHDTTFLKEFRESGIQRDRGWEEFAYLQVPLPLKPENMELQGLGTTPGALRESLPTQWPVFPCERARTVFEDLGSRSSREWGRFKTLSRGAGGSVAQKPIKGLPDGLEILSEIEGPWYFSWYHFSSCVTFSQSTCDFRFRS